MGRDKTQTGQWDHHKKCWMFKPCSNLRLKKLGEDTYIYWYPPGYPSPFPIPKVTFLSPGFFRTGPVLVGYDVSETVPWRALIEKPWILTSTFNITGWWFFTNPFEKKYAQPSNLGSWNLHLPGSDPLGEHMPTNNMGKLPPLPTRFKNSLGSLCSLKKKLRKPTIFHHILESTRPRDWGCWKRTNTGIEISMSLFLGSLKPLPETNSNIAPENGWERNTIVSFWVSAYFQGQAVSFRECNRWDRWYIITQKRQEKYHLGLPLIVLAFCWGYMLPTTY